MTRRTQTPWETTLALKFPPLAVFYANEIPPNARPLVGRCAALALAQAARGETVYVDLENCRCPGAVGGLALGPFASERFPCGASGFERFFSTGFAGWPPGDEALAQMEPAARRKFEKGEGYAPTPDAAKRYVASLPTVEPEGVCIVFKPLAKLTSNETPKTVVFLVDADALSALVVLANYVRGASTDAVRIPFASGCASVALFPFAEGRRRAGDRRRNRRFGAARLAQSARRGDRRVRGALGAFSKNGRFRRRKFPFALRLAQDFGFETRRRRRRKRLDEAEPFASSRERVKKRRRVG